MIKVSDQDKEIDIIIKCSNGLNVVYNNITSPENFILNLIDEQYDIPKPEGISAFSSHVNSIHIKETGDDNGFYEMWNSSIFNEYPFNNEINREFLTFFLIEKEFTRTYLSMYFPFKYGFILDYWEYLSLGDAYYSVYINDTEVIINSHFGLSYNNNIRWNSKLKAKYDYGFFNPFSGEYDGIIEDPYKDYNISTDKISTTNPFESLFSSYFSHGIDYMDIMIPMSAKEEIERRNNNHYLWYSSNPDFDSEVYYDEKELFAQISKLNFDKFKELYQKNPLKILLNENIWKNTLKDILDQKFCYSFFEMLKINNDQNT